MKSNEMRVSRLVKGVKSVRRVEASWKQRGFRWVRSKPSKHAGRGWHFITAIAPVSDFAAFCAEEGRAQLAEFRKT